MHYTPNTRYTEAYIFGQYEKGNFKFIFYVFRRQLVYYIGKFPFVTDAEALADDVFLKLWDLGNGNIDNCNEKIKSGKHLKSWLYTVAKRMLVDEYRKLNCKKRKISWIDFQDEMKGSFLETELMELFDNLDIFSCIEALPPGSRRVLKMIFLENYSAKDAAVVLGVGVATVYGQLKRSIRLIRKELETRHGIKWDGNIPRLKMIDKRKYSEYDNAKGGDE